MVNVLLFKILTMLIMVSLAWSQAGDRKYQKEDKQIDPIPLHKIPPAPALKPEQAINSFDIAPGFVAELVASEPDLHDPVALKFDADGRMWVVEMRGYMPNVDGIGEDEPVGRISILDDADQDGYYENYRVFLDHLILPRALTFVQGGVLYGDHQKLVFVEITGNRDTAGQQTIIDAEYAAGGDVEHKPNGLLHGLDNWIYSATCGKRYRYIDGAWQAERTEFRGQWGITQDDYGRLFYNHRGLLLQGEALLPNTITQNPHHELLTQPIKNLSGDNRLYPRRITPGVNRAYGKDVLDHEGKIKTPTSASGPVIYRGTNFPAEFYGNAFTPEPAANLIKRLIVEEKQGVLTTRQAYRNKEFLASTDERFRPVNLYNAPDGSLYVIDFYRGILQHHKHMTTYLRQQIQRRQLDTPVGLGRIYRIKYQRNPLDRVPRLSERTSADLIASLSSRNPWQRQTAQRLLVERQDTSVIPALIKLVGQSPSHLAQIHALWVLEGLDAVSPDAIAPALTSQHVKVIVSAMRVSETLADSSQAQTVLDMLSKLIKHPHREVQLQLARTLSHYSRNNGFEPLLQLTQHIAKEERVVDAIMSGLYNREADFLAALQAHDAKFFWLRRLIFRFSQLYRALEQAIEKQRQAVAAAGPSLAITPELQAVLNQGKQLYEQYCMSCHHRDGTGIFGLGPPLKKSEWMMHEHTLILIALHGVEGPIHVNGKQYTTPEVMPAMPGVKHLPALDDTHLAATLTYIRNAWGNQASAVKPAAVKAARDATKNRTAPYTERELKRLNASYAHMEK